MFTEMELSQNATKNTYIQDKKFHIFAQKNIIHF